jgi:hypothetical protein
MEPLPKVLDVRLLVSMLPHVDADHLDAVLLCFAADLL